MKQIYVTIPKGELPVYAQNTDGPNRAFAILDCDSGTWTATSWGRRSPMLTLYGIRWVVEFPREMLSGQQLWFELSPYASSEKLRSFLEQQVSLCQRIIAGYTKKEREDESAPHNLAIDVSFTQDAMLARKELEKATHIFSKECTCNHKEVVTCEQAIADGEFWKEGETLREAATRHIEQAQASDKLICEVYYNQYGTSLHMMALMEHRLMEILQERIDAGQRQVTPLQYAALETYFPQTLLDSEELTLPVEIRGEMSCTELAEEYGLEVWMYEGNPEKPEHLLKNAERFLREKSLERGISLSDPENMKAAVLEGTWKALAGKESLARLPDGVEKLLRKDNPDRMEELLRLDDDSAPSV